MTPIHGLRICFVPIEDTRLCCIFQISLCSDTNCSTFATVSREYFSFLFAKLKACSGCSWLPWIGCRVLDVRGRPGLAAVFTPSKDGIILNFGDWSALDAVFAG